MKQIQKKYEIRNVVHVDGPDYDQLLIKSKELGITRTHLVRIIIYLYLQGKIDVSEYVPLV